VDFKLNDRGIWRSFFYGRVILPPPEVCVRIHPGAKYTRGPILAGGALDGALPEDEDRGGKNRWEEV